MSAPIVTDGGSNLLNMNSWSVLTSLNSGCQTHFNLKEVTLPPETFWTLLHDAAHWEFEIFLMVIFDGLIGYVGYQLFWPFLRKHWKHHLDRDEREAGLVRPNFTPQDVLEAYGVSPEYVVRWELTSDTLTVVLRKEQPHDCDSSRT